MYALRLGNTLRACLRLAQSLEALSCYADKHVSTVHALLVSQTTYMHSAVSISSRQGPPQEPSLHVCCPCLCHRQQLATPALQMPVNLTLLRGLHHTRTTRSQVCRTNKHNGLQALGQHLTAITLLPCFGKKIHAHDSSSSCSRSLLIATISQPQAPTELAHAIWLVYNKIRQPHKHPAAELLLMCCTLLPVLHLQSHLLPPSCRSCTYREPPPGRHPQTL